MFIGYSFKILTLKLCRQLKFSRTKSVNLLEYFHFDCWNVQMYFLNEKIFQLA